MSEGKGGSDFLALGDWNAMCWECGRKKKAGDLWKYWQGYYICPRHWNPRQPQDFAKGIKETITPPWVQPMAAYTFTGPSTLVVSVTTPGPIIPLIPPETVPEDTTILVVETPVGPVGPAPLIPAIVEGVPIDIILQPVPGTGTATGQNMQYQWVAATGISATLSTVSISPSSVIASDDVATFTITVTLKNYSGVVVEGDTVTLTAGAGVNITPASGVSDGSGQVVFTATSLVAQTATFTATDTTEGIVLAQTPTGVYGISPDSCSVESDEVQRVGTADTVNITLYDGALNPVIGHLITMTADPAGPVFTPTSAVSDVNGQVSFSVTGNAAGITTYTAYDNTQGVALTTQPETDFLVPVPLDADFLTNTVSGDYALLWDGTGEGALNGSSAYSIAANYGSTWYLYDAVSAPYAIRPTDSVSPLRALPQLPLPWLPAFIIDAPDLTNLLVWRSPIATYPTPYLYDISAETLTAQTSVAIIMEEPTNPVRTGDYVFWYKGNSNGQTIYRETISSGLIIEIDLPAIIPDYTDEFFAFTANATHLIVAGDWDSSAVALIDLSGNYVSTVSAGFSGIIFDSFAVADSTYLLLQNATGSGEGSAVVTLSDGTTEDITTELPRHNGTTGAPKLTNKDF